MFTATSSTRTLPPKIKAINEKVVTTRSAAEAAELEKYHKEGVKQIANVKIPQGGIYAVAFRPDGKVLAAAGADGIVRFINPETGSLVKEFAPVTVKTRSIAQNAAVAAVLAQAGGSRRDRGPPQGCEPGVAGSSAQGDSPEQSVRLRPASCHRQARLRAKRSTSPGWSSRQLSAGIVEVSRSGLVRPKADGKGSLTLRLAGKTATVPVTVLG